MFKSITRLASKFHDVKNMEEFNKVVSGLKSPYVLDFYADWCGPCKMLTPIITKLQSESEGKWALIKVNVDEESLSELVDKHQVQGIPTLAFYKGAQKIHQKSGSPNEADLKALVEKHLL